MSWTCILSACPSIRTRKSVTPFTILSSSNSTRSSSPRSSSTCRATALWVAPIPHRRPQKAEARLGQHHRTQLAKKTRARAPVKRAEWRRRWSKIAISRLEPTILSELAAETQRWQVKIHLLSLRRRPSQHPRKLCSRITSQTCRRYILRSCHPWTRTKGTFIL